MTCLDVQRSVALIGDSTGLFQQPCTFLGGHSLFASNRVGTDQRKGIARRRAPAYADDRHNGWGNQACSLSRVSPKPGVGLSCALSSVEEHFLHTEGVAGSSPAARTSLSPPKVSNPLGFSTTAPSSGFGRAPFERRVRRSIRRDTAPPALHPGPWAGPKSRRPEWPGVRCAACAGPRARPLLRAHDGTSGEVGALRRAPAR